MANDSRFLNVSVQRTAKEIRNYRWTKKAIMILAAALALLIVITFVISIMYTRYGSFTITINKFNSQQYSISLCETADFSKPKMRLDCNASEEIDNIDGTQIDMTKAGSVDGLDSGENYLCYTFYLKNMGTDAVNVSYSIIITNITQNLDEAVRYRLVFTRGSERTQTDYAKAAGVNEETGEVIPEVGTVPFEDAYTICTEKIAGLLPQEICKFTIVIWLEGWDLECENDKLGGQFKSDMKFSVEGLVEE